MQLVIDTNIIISSLISEGGKTASFMDKVFVNCYDIVITENILAEYSRKLFKELSHYYDGSFSLILHISDKNED